jgi:FeS assembly SUF system protein
METTNTAGHDELKGKIVEVLKTVYDPEIPVDIYELGLVYKIDVDADANVRIEMTLTSPGCPVAGTLPIEVEQKTRGVDGVNDVKVEIVWDPPWTPERMSEAAKLQLNM